MTYAATNSAYPATEDVMSLYEEINTAHTNGHLDDDQWQALLTSAAEAETQDELANVMNQLKEHTSHEVE